MVCHMSAKLASAANFTSRHERSHSLRLAVVAVAPGMRAADRTVLAVLVGMGYHFEVVAEAGASIAVSHMRQAQATDIRHWVVVAAEDIHRVVAQTAPVLAQGLVRQRLSVTREAW